MIKTLGKIRQASVEGSNQTSNSVSTESFYCETKYFVTLPLNNTLEFHEKNPNKVNSFSVEDVNRTKRKIELIACSSLRTLPNNHLEFQDKNPIKENLLFVKDANQSK